MELNLKSERAFWWVAIALFMLLTIITYFPCLYGKVPFPRDMVLQFSAWSGMARSEAWQTYADIGDLVSAFYPARAFAARAVREGTLPLWNPYFLGGAPFLASPQSSLFYPPNFLYYVLPLPAAWTFCIMLQMFLSGIFMTTFVRSIGASKAGAIFSGIVFALCGFMTAWQGQPMDDGATWLPFVCYAVVRLQKEPSARSIALAAVGFAMPVLAGHPEAAAHVTLVGLAQAFAAWLSSRLQLQFLQRFTAAGILAMGIASIQMIPTLEWLRELPSALNLTWPVLPLHQIFGWVSRDIIRGPNSAGVWVPEAAAYVGMISLLVAPLGLLHRARRHVVFLTVITIAATAIAYGFPPVHWLVMRTPVLSGLKNGRMIFIAGFGVAALAGLGISILEEEVPLPARRRILAIALVTIVFASAFLLAYRLQLITEFKVEFTRRPSFSRTLLIAALIPIVWRLYGRLQARTFVIAACAILAFDLLTYRYGYSGFAWRDEIFPPTPAFDFLMKNSDPARFRVATAGLPYPANANIVYGIASVDGYEVRLTIPHRSFSLDYTENRMDGIFFTPSRILGFNDRRLDMLNVRYLVVPSRSTEFDQLSHSQRFSNVYNKGYIAVLENESVLPRAFLAPIKGLEVVPDINQQLGRLRNPTFDPQKSVVVSAKPSPFEANQPTRNAFGLPLVASVDLVESHINDSTFRTTTFESDIFVLSQTYYPGWTATIDGTETDVFPVDIALTGINLPAGVHEVRFAFRPASFKVGAIITLIALVITARLFFWST